MAEHSESSMDMDVHRDTYSGFLQLTVAISMLSIAIVIMLAVGGVGGSWGLAGLGVFLSVIAATLGFMMNGSPVPVIVVIVAILALKLLMG